MSLAARRLVAHATLALLIAVGAWPASAHEGGAARVSLSFHKNGTYLIEVSLDPEHLPRAPQGTSAEEIGDAFVGSMTLDFDGVHGMPRKVATAVPGEGPGVGPSTGSGLGNRIVVYLEGRTPTGARSVKVRAGAPVGEILVEVRNEGVETPERQRSRTGWDAGPFAIAAASEIPSIPAIFASYLALGFRHIIPDGLDHILFVLGLFLASRKLSSLLAQITAFTVAHSITLGLAMLNVVSLPASIVEPAIAISIVFVAVENLIGKEVGRTRVALVFGFGLLHGLGFAGALREVGLPPSRFLSALLSFNLGVEAGQLTVIAIAFAAVGAWFSRRSWYRARVTVPASIAIAAVGLYWTIERLL